MESKRSPEHKLLPLKEHNAGRKVADICRNPGIAEGTFYRWRPQFSGTELSEAKRLGEPETGIAKPKKMLTEAMPDNAALKDVVAKKW